MNDGCDYVHRETVAEHYKKSVQYKAYLRALILLNLALVALANVIQYKCQSIDETVCQSIPILAIVWTIVCLIGCAAGAYSSRSNNIRILLISQWINKLFAPAILAFSIVNSIYTFFENEDATTAGACVFFIFHVIAFQIHLLVWYVQSVLIDAWTIRKKKH